MRASRFPIGPKAPWYVPSWYNAVRAFRKAPPFPVGLASVVVPLDRSPCSPIVRIDPEHTDAEVPQAWEVRMPDGSAEWFYNYFGAITEAAARGMRLPAESDWTAFAGEFPGIWLPSR